VWRDRQAAEPEGLAVHVLPDVERVVEEGGPLAHDAGERGEMSPPARRQPDGGSARGATGPGVEVAQRGEIEGVVGVEVADDDTGEAQGIGDGPQAADDAVSAIQEHCRRPGLDEEAGGGGIGLRRCGAAPDDGQAHAKRSDRLGVVMTAS